MSTVTFPLDNVKYFANAPGAWLGTRTRGVFAADADYATTANGNMTITVSAGLAWLKYSDRHGVSVYTDAPVTLNLDTADGSSPRIDAVMLRLDKIANGSTVTIRKGTPASSPVASLPVRDANTDEIVLAHVLVPAATLVIGPEHITDKRMDEALCGVMRDGVTGLPTASLQQSAETVLAQIRAEYAATTGGSAWLTKTDYHPDTGTNPLQPKTDNALTTVAKTIVGAIGELLSAITGHKNDKANPHAVTKAQVGLTRAMVAINGNYHDPKATADEYTAGELVSYALDGSPVNAPTGAEGAKVTLIYNDGDANKVLLLSTTAGAWWYCNKINGTWYPWYRPDAGNADSLGGVGPSGYISKAAGGVANASIGAAHGVTPANSGDRFHNIHIPTLGNAGVMYVILWT